MSYQKAFRACGKNVEIADDVIIEHPGVMEVGDNVKIMKGVCLMGKPKVFRIGNEVTIYPYVFFQGSPGRIVIGDDVQFFPYNYVSSGDWECSFVEVGNHTHFAPGCVLYGWGGLKVGNYCAIASNTMLATVKQHTRWVDRPMVEYAEHAQPITIEDDVYISANVVVAGNVRIRKGCVIGGGAVVTHDTEPYGFYVGVPARLKYKRVQGEPPFFPG